MKHFYSVICLPFLIAVLLMGSINSSSVQAASPNTESPNVASPAIKSVIPDSNVWEHLGKTRTGECYYKKATITDSPVISVTTYKIVNDDFRKEKIEKVKQYDEELAKKYQYFDYNIIVDEIDCKNKLWRMIEYADYDGQGQVLSVHTIMDNDWQKILILTAHDKLRQLLCAPEEKPSQEKKEKKEKKIKIKKKKKRK